MSQIKGSVLKARLAFVEQNFGNEGVERVLEALLSEDQRALRGVLSAKWYPFELGKRLDEAIVASVGGGSPDFFVRLGEASAEKNLTTVHRDFLVPGDPQAFLVGTPTIYSFYYDRGHRTYQQLGPKEGVITTYDADTFSAADCLTVVGWHRKALEMCGATEVRIVEEECRARGAEVCRYRVSWS